MNQRERIVAALRGEMPDRVPWTIYTAALPRGAVERELRNHGLAIMTAVNVHAIDRPNVHLVERTTTDGGETVQYRTYQTPLGEITEKRLVEPGYNSYWTVEHFVKQPKDYEVLEYVIRDATFRPDYEPLLKAQAEIGTDGVVNTAVNRTPYQRLWVEYVGLLDRFLFDLNDYPILVEGVLRALLEKDTEMWQVVADSPAEFVWAPDNMTSQAISPRLFERYCEPYYESLCEVMHRHGKRVYSHMDGSLRALADQIARTPLDIIEAFTPTPTGDFSVAEARAAWRGKVLWINYPSSVHVEPPERIAAVTREILRQAAPGDGFLVSITENIPEDAIATSLTAITEVMEKFGECPLGA